MYAMIRTIEMIQTITGQKRRDEKGASAVEYGLLVALIAAVIVLAVATLGQTVLGAFNDTNTGINA